MYDHPTGACSIAVRNARSMCAGAFLVLCAGRTPLPAQERVAFRHLTIANGLSQNAISAIVQDRPGFMWFGTKDGLNRYDGYQFVTRSGGVDRFDRNRERFERLRAGPTRNITAIAEDRSGAIWVGSFAEGLFRLTTDETGAVTAERFTHSATDPGSLADDRVGAAVVDRHGVVWVGTESGLDRRDPASPGAASFTHIPAEAKAQKERVKPRPGASLTTIDTRVSALYEDARGRLWIGSVPGLSVFDSARTRARHYYHRYRTYRYGWGEAVSLAGDRSGKLWLSTRAELMRFDPATGGLEYFRHDPREPASLSHDAVRSILPDPREPDRFLWVGTAGGGLNRLDVGAGTFVHFTEQDGLPNNVVYAVLADTSRTLWLSTNKGLSRFDPATKRVRNYDADDGLQSDEFNSGAAFGSRDGELFFGGSYGFSYFRPEDIHDNPNVPAVAITGFRRGNRFENVRDTGTVLPTTISEADSLRLTHRDAVLTFDFAALEYSAPAKNRYAYPMVGFNNDEWVESGAVRTATYTNLPPGHYRFQVRASNNDGVWNERGTSLAIDILPPWWQTWWAYSFYAALLLAAFYGARRYEMNRLRLKSRFEIEHLEAEQLRELDRARSRLFANVSHEFRTPLTLTMGPLDDLRAGLHGSLSPAVAEQVDLARRNAGRVLDLINEILDLARAESGRETVRARRVDLGQFVGSIADTFLPLAERKAIAYDVQMSPERVVIYADPEHFDRALSNLLSNAFKFTPVGGAVRVSVGGDDNSARIVVRDSGPGIPGTDLDLIFDRFHRAKTAGTQPGTGIGLALARELIALHGGSITVESEEGFGSTFTITLRRGKAHLAPEQIVDESVAPAWTPRGVSSCQSVTESSDASPPNGDRLAPPDADVTTVLVADDNAEVRAYVKAHLSPRYRVLEAVNGEQGLEIARRALPDLVLSDVMMPVMDGYGLCRALRADPETDFIPIILLTARAEAEDKLTGLAEQADDYLTKPFDVRELLARIGNIIAMRRRLRERFAAERLTIHPAPVDVAPADRRFVEQVRAAIEAHLGGETFTVERLAAEVGQSRANLHRKLRELIGESPSDLIRRMRLERAANLLEAGAGSVGEIAYAVGFKSVAHFSNAFLEQTGVRPSAWREHGIAKAVAQRETVGRSTPSRASS